MSLTGVGSPSAGAGSRSSASARYVSPVRPHHRLLAPAAAGALVLVVFAVAARAHLAAAVIPQDEGLLLTYPDLVLRGGVPNGTFQSVYGPGTIYVLAGVFKVLGPGVLVERLLGFGYRALLATAVYLLLRRYSAPAAVIGAVVAAITAVTTPPTHASLGSLAFALLAVVAAHRATLTRGLASAAASGLLAGVAVWFRPDVALATGLGVVLLIVRWQRRQISATTVGLLVGAVPTVLNLVQAGPTQVLRSELVEPIFVSSSGRKLPFTSLGPRFMLCGLVVLAIIVLLVGLGFWLRRRDPAGPVLMSLGLFSAGFIPYVLSRSDMWHLSVAAPVPYAATPLLVACLRRHVHRPTWLVPAGAVLVAAVFAGSIGHAFHGTVKQSITPAPTVAVANAGRSVPTVDGTAQAIIDQLEAAAAGTRATVAILPADTSKAYRSDTYLYFLLPEHTPGTFYLEMDPGVANGFDSRLSLDLSSVDYVITNSADDDSVEPNTSRVSLSQAANEVLRSKFVEVGHAGTFTLLRRAA